jgi:hypothetical protein
VYTSSSLPTSSIVAANTDPLSMSDVRRIFYGKRVVFAGDPAVRSLYRDMATFLVKGHRLNNTNITIQTGHKLCSFCAQSNFFFYMVIFCNLVNECRVRVDGRPGMLNYVDERVCQWAPSSSLHYIYLASLDGQESNELLRLVPGADLVILSSVRSDMNRYIICVYLNLF